VTNAVANGGNAVARQETAKRLLQWLMFAAAVLILVIGGLVVWHQRHPSHECVDQNDLVVCPR
jgi:uncharacterized Tic20 family protein